MKAVLLWELHKRWMFTIWWTLGISALLAVTVLAYGSVKGQAAVLNQSFGSLTSSAGSFFGGSDFFSPVGYLSSQVYYIVLPLVLIILAITLSSSLMNKDEADTTIELTLARPVSRSQVLSGKAVAGLIIIGVVMVCTYIVTVICVKATGIEVSQKNLLITHLLSYAFSVSFGALSFALSALSRFTQRIASVIAIIFSFGGYIISSLASFEKALKPFAYVFPYHYYNTVDLLNGSVNHNLLLYLIIILVAATLASRIGYVKRDIG